nr:Ppx/GppA family phosphatase [Paracoccus sp. S-4012]
MLDDPSARLLRRVGVVDVGSNSIRMVVFDGAARSPAYFYNEKVMAGLGAGLASTGRLNPEGVTRGLEALRRFAELARGMDVAPLTCVATAAVREAEDGPDFHARAEAESGLTLHVVDGREEARLSGQGVLLGWPDAEGLVCDIGGNSMEVAVVGGGTVGARVSSPLGPFRLQQVKGGAAGRRRHIRAVMKDLGEAVGTGHGRIFLVGGSWRAIARIDMERRGYPMTVLHEYRMTPEDLTATIEHIAATDTATLKAATGISSTRLELVPLAAEVLRELTRAFAPEEFAVSSFGIREGLLYEQMSPSLRERDPLIEAARFTEKKMARMPGFGRKLFQFLLPLFEGASAQRQRLILAACLLHDTAWRAHPDYRAEACFDNVTRANLAALSHPERVFLGVALLHRYKSSRANSPMAPLFALLSADELRDAEVLGKAMRFGAMFSVRNPGTAGRLSVDAGVLRLKLTKTGRALMGEVALARFRSLASAMGATAEVV